MRYDRFDRPSLFWKVFPFAFGAVFIIALTIVLGVWGFIGYTVYTEGVDGLMPTIKIEMIKE